MVDSSRRHKTTYTFFVTEEPRAMIDSHAQFVVEHHRETDPSDPCYHGFLMWDMVNKRRINSSFNPYSEDWWRGAAMRLAWWEACSLGENVYRPVEEELRRPGRLCQRLPPLPPDGTAGLEGPPDGARGTPCSNLAATAADDVWRAYNYVQCR